MREAALNYYVCAHCHSSRWNMTSPAASASGEILEAQLACCCCHASFPVKNGVPRFVDSDNYAESFGYQWNLHRQTQLDSRNGSSVSRDRLFGVTGWDKKLPGQTILEAGSGAGRFTEILLDTNASVFSFDLSAAVDANWANNGARANLNLFQGNVYDIPLRAKSFDKVLCLGVIQHTPDPARAFSSLAAMVRPGGELVVDVYRKSVTGVLQWKYFLRPVAKRMKKETLYRVIEKGVPPLMPIAGFLRRVGGRASARCLPFVEYGSLGLPEELNCQFSILDTFDMYSPAHDHPQSMRTVQKWYQAAGFVNVVVRPGPNGVIGKGFLSV